MKTDRFLFIKELLTEQMNHWFLFPLALILMGTNKEPKEYPNVMLWFLLSMLPILFYALRCEIEKFSFSLLLHIIAAALVILASGRVFSDADQVICIFCALGYMVYSFFLKTIGRQSYTKSMQLPWGVGISAAAMLLQRSDKWISYYCFALIASLALFFVLFYMDHYLEFLAVNKSSTGYIPTSEMLRSGLGLVIGYSLLGAVLMIISTHFSWTLDFLSSLKSILKQFLHNIFSNLFHEEQLHPSMGAGTDLPSEPLPVSEPFWLWNVLAQIAELVFAAIFVFAAVKLLIKFIRWLEGFMNRTHSEDTQGEEAFDVREKCDLGENGEAKRKNFSDVFSYRERIRRLYKKKILAFSAKTAERERGRLGYYTAREWERKMEEGHSMEQVHSMEEKHNTPIENEGMAVIYERARYSEHEITAEDVKKMKDVCKM